jgi:hypothetical protein
MQPGRRHVKPQRICLSMSNEIVAVISFIVAMIITFIAHVWSNDDED